MGITRFPHGVSSFGIPVIGSGSILTTGKIFFVDSVTGSNGNSGESSDQPFATIDYAVGMCTANKGDYIIVMPNHAETIAGATSLVLDVAGVSIIGLGRGDDRPTLNFTATASKIPISAAGISVENILITGGIDAVVNAINISAADVSLINIETKDVTGQMTNVITTTAAADRLLIDGWTHRGAAAAGTASAISIVGGEGVRLRNLWIDGNFSSACVLNAGTASTNITVGGFNQESYCRTRNVADVIVTLHANATGNVGPNIAARLQDDAANITAAFVGAQCQFFQPIIICNADGEVGMNTTITATTNA